MTKPRAQAFAFAWTSSFSMAKIKEKKRNNKAGAICLLSHQMNSFVDHLVAVAVSRCIRLIFISVIYLCLFALVEFFFFFFLSSLYINASCHSLRSDLIYAKRTNERWAVQSVCVQRTQHRQNIIHQLIIAVTKYANFVCFFA